MSDTVAIVGGRLDGKPVGSGFGENDGLPAGIVSADTGEAQPITDEIWDVLGDANELIIHERHVTVNEKVYKVGIRQFSFDQANGILAKRFRRGVGKAPVLDVTDANRLVNAHALLEGVYKNIAPEGEPPIWVPFFTSLEQLLGTASKYSREKKQMEAGRPGLLANAHDAAQELFYGLLQCVFECNPTINPMVAAQAAETLGAL